MTAHGRRIRTLGVVGVLVVSAIGLPAGFGFATTALAAAGNVSVTPGTIQSSGSVTLNATAATGGRDLTFAIDGDRNGSITSDEHLDTVTTSASGVGNVTFTPQGVVSAGDGEYTIYVVEEADGDGADDTSYPVSSPGSFYDVTATVTVDDTPPSISNFTVSNPTGQEVLVSFTASEALHSIRVDVTGTENGTLTEQDFVGTGTGPYTYNATYFADSDGVYTATLKTAADGVGNAGAVGHHATTVAGTSSRNADTVLRPQATIFLGEEGIDVSPIVAGDQATFVGISGAADGQVATASATHVDFTRAGGFVPGGYDTSGDDTVDLTVAEPQVRDVTLALGPPNSSIDATDGYVPPDATVTVSADFNFNTADSLSVSVASESGLDIAKLLTAAPNLPSSGDALELDLADADVEPGTYTVLVEGQTLNASASVTFTVTARDASISLDRTRIVRGESVIATALGDPGGTVVVQLSKADLSENDSTRTARATAVFANTDDVSNRTDANTDHVAAVLELGRDGIAQTRIDTAHLATDETVHVELVTGGADRIGDSPDDSTRLRTQSRVVTVSTAPRSIPIGEHVDITGHAPQSETIKAYAERGDDWYPLRASTSSPNAPGWAVDDVNATGAFIVTVDSAAVIDQPGVYRIALVGDPDYSVAGVRDGGDTTTRSDDVLTRSAMSEQRYASFMIRSQLEEFDASLTRKTIAATGRDEVELHGTLTGGEDPIHVYHIGPHGTIVAETIEAHAGSFDTTYDGFDRLGPHRFLVISSGRDGTFARSSPRAVVRSIPETATQRQAVERIRAAYTDAGVDDGLIELQLDATVPSVTIASVDTNTTLTPDASGRQLVVSGETNHEPASIITLSLLDSTGDVVRETTTNIVGWSGEWNATIDASRLPPGNYTLRATDGDVSATTRFSLSETRSRPSTTHDTASTDSVSLSSLSVGTDTTVTVTSINTSRTTSRNVTPSVSADRRTEAPGSRPRPATTAHTSGPSVRVTHTPGQTGFGVVAGVIAVLIVVLARRRH